MPVIHVKTAPGKSIGMNLPFSRTKPCTNPNGHSPALIYRPTISPAALMPTPSVLQAPGKSNVVNPERGAAYAIEHNSDANISRAARLVRWTFWGFVCMANLPYLAALFMRQNERIVKSGETIWLEITGQTAHAPRIWSGIILPTIFVVKLESRDGCTWQMSSRSLILVCGIMRWVVVYGFETSTRQMVRRIGWPPSTDCIQPHVLWYYVGITSAFAAEIKAAKL